MNKNLIIGLSILIPIAVALLFGIKIEGYDFSFLPSIYAGINALTFILLLFALRAIKKGNQRLHETIIKICLALSCLFLMLYIAYHITSDSTHFGGEGMIKYVYYTLLISHILLSVIIIPLVLFTFHYAQLEQFDKHKKLAKISFPLWLYVTFSGVLVYLMISPYYV